MIDVIGAIYLRHIQSLVIFLKDFIPDRSECFAVAAPWGKKFNNPKTIIFQHDVMKIFVSEFDDIVVSVVKRWDCPGGGR